MKALFSTLILVYLSFTLLGQAGPPPVFLMGDHQSEYAIIAENYPSSLLEETDFDMNVAYAKWISMLQEMQASAETLNVDLKGLKLWMNIFFQKDGTIDYIVYHFKPNSRNVPPTELTAFFKVFIRDYKFPIMAERPFVHFGHATFPVYMQH